MRIPHDIFQYILSFRDLRYEVALSEGTPSAAAIRSVFTDWPESLGSLLSKKGSCVCWVIDDETAVVFTMRRVQNAMT